MKLVILLDGGAKVTEYEIGVKSREEGNTVIRLLETAEGKFVRLLGNSGDMLINTERIILAQVNP